MDEVGSARIVQAGRDTEIWMRAPVMPPVNLTFITRIFETAA